MWISPFDPIAEPITACENCGAKRVYETQLVSSLISLHGMKIGNLQPTDTHGIEFGVCCVFSCSKSCVKKDQKIIIEHVIVQKEV